VQRLMERGVLDDGRTAAEHTSQPGQCCDSGCTVPEAPKVVSFQPRKTVN
jgi:4-hydroxybutyryl-CoA dehydratase/vinylacetyl-CoA-Delta-isomerase